MIQGYRAYQLYHTPDNFWLLKGMWLPWPGRELTAECFYSGFGDMADRVDQPRDPTRKAKFEEHIQSMEKVKHPPNGGECGIYIVETEADIWRGMGDPKVRAFVTGWGLTAEYEHGWRCQFVRIEHIEIQKNIRWHESLEEIIQDLAERYQVPISLAWDPNDGKEPPVYSIDHMDWDAAGWAV